MKIKAKKETIASMKLIVPVDGIIVIDAEGVADVSEKCADLLVNNTNDWDYISEKSEKKETISEENIVKEEKTDIDNEREMLEKTVRSAKISELKEMCAEAEFPESEWKNLTKALLAAYILKKYDEASVE